MEHGELVRLNWLYNNHIWFRNLVQYLYKALETCDRLSTVDFIDAMKYAQHIKENESGSISKGNEILSKEQSSS